jgi:hypothetical protein
VNVDAYGAFGYMVPSGAYERYLLHTLEAVIKPVVAGAGYLSEDEVDELISYVKAGRLPTGWTAGLAWGQRPN